MTCNEQQDAQRAARRATSSNLRSCSTADWQQQCPLTRRAANRAQQRHHTSTSLPCLLRASQRIFRNVTTSDDPVMRKLAAEGAGRVFATDSILSALMCAKSSVYR